MNRHEGTYDAVALLAKKARGEDCTFLIVDILRKGTAAGVIDFLGSFGVEMLSKDRAGQLDAVAGAVAAGFAKAIGDLP